MNNQDVINKVVAEIAMEKGIKEYDVNQYLVILRLADMIVKNCSIPDVSGRSKQLCQFEQDERYDSNTCKHCGGNKWMHEE